MSAEFLVFVLAVNLFGLAVVVFRLWRRIERLEFKDRTGGVLR